MKAIAIYPGEGKPHFSNIEEPAIKNNKDIKAEVICVGICGTDIGQIRGGRADAPEGSNELVIGHEVLCRITETGEYVKKVKPGDYGVFTVRRGCGECLPCNMNRSDMCLTGNYKERGIKQLNGYQAEYIVDSESYIVKVPDELKHLGILIEPASIAEKAINEGVSIQISRIPGYKQKGGIKTSRVLVAGIGSVGLLTAFILANRGAEVFGLDIVDENSIRPTILKEIGGKYINGKNIKAGDIDEVFGEMDMIVEAAGISELGFNLTDALGVNGIYIMTGIPEGERRISVPGDNLMRQLVLKNQILLGSVNASIDNFHSAAIDFSEINSRWGKSISKIITRKVKANDFSKAFEKGPSDIKTIITWKDF